jgi:ribosomal protein S18 acetylase RimI-like enzyme
MSNEVSPISFEMCLPIEEHAWTVMTWRNDPVTLSMSFHRGPKLWEAFWSEYQDTYFLNRPELRPVFALLERKRIGFLKFNPVPHPFGLPRSTVDISINIAPASRAKGLGRKVIAACLEHLRSRGVESVYAEVLAHNDTSIKTFTAVGFKPIGRKDKLNPDSGETDRVQQFVAELTAPGLIGPDGGSSSRDAKP